MNLAHHVAAVAFVASLLAVSVLPAMSSPTHEPGTSAEGACAAAESASAVTGDTRAMGDGVAASPQCNYLAKCCGGNTPNAAKCCAGYFKKCGKDGS